MIWGWMKLTKINEGVLIIASHLIITLAVLLVYVYTLYTGADDETLKTVLTVIVGYWFGSMGVTAIKKDGTKK